MVSLLRNIGGCGKVFQKRFPNCFRKIPKSFRLTFSSSSLLAHVRFLFPVTPKHSHAMSKHNKAATDKWKEKEILSKFWLLYRSKVSAFASSSCNSLSGH